MKTPYILKIFYFLILCFLIHPNLKGQSAISGPSQNNPPLWRCYYDEILQQRRATEPNISNIIAQQQAQIDKNRNNGRISAAATTMKTIPVVVHVIYDQNLPYTNISHAQIVSQIQAANNHLAANNANVQLCLATVTPSNPNYAIRPFAPNEPGVTRTKINNQSWTADANGQKSLVSFVAYPYSDYLNIWVVSEICFPGGGNCGQIQGFAPRPINNNDPLDGIVMRYSVFGDNTGGGSYNLPPNNQHGNIFVHELGHYLYLWHTFEGGCSGTDYVPDTPPCQNPYWYCANPGPANSCPGSVRALNNYMDYTNDSCMSNLTPGQIGNIHGALSTYRTNLYSSGNLTATGVHCIPTSLQARISVSSTNPCVNEVDTFECKLPTGTAISYNWSFPGSTTPKLTGKGPHLIIYPTAGVYDVGLTAKDAAGNTVSDTLINGIVVMQCNTIANTGNAVWQFGQYVGLDFRNPKPTLFYPSYVAVYGTSCQSDPTNSQYLFSCDGIKIYDSQNNAIVTLTHPYQQGFGNFGANGVITVPNPANPNEYCIFNTEPYGVQTNISGLYQTTIDVSQVNTNGTKGVVSSGKLSVPVSNSGYLADGLIAVPTCDGLGHWIIAAGNKSNTGKLYAYKFTATGINSNAVVSSSGYVTTDTAHTIIKVSPDGTKLAIATYGWTLTGAAIMYPYFGVYLYDFDKETGQITFIREIAPEMTYGISFSPNSKLLYVATSHGTVQYDLRDGASCNPPPFTSLPAQSALPYGKLQLGPDGRIYQSIYWSGVGNSNGLNVIDFPDSINTTLSPNNCGFVFNPPHLKVNAYGSGNGSYSTTFVTLPNDLDCKIGSIPAEFDFCVKQCSKVDFHLRSCGTNISWNFGDGTSSTLTNPTHTYPNPVATTTYNVVLTLTNGSGITISKTHQLTLLPAVHTIMSGKDTVCAKNAYAYSLVPTSSYSYQWGTINGSVNPSTGNTVQATFQVPGNASISVIATSPNGCIVKDSIKILVKPSPSAQVISSKTITMGSCVSIGGPSVSGDTYSWSSNPSGFTSSVSNPSVCPTVYTFYHLIETSPNGCSNSNTTDINPVGCYNNVTFSDTLGVPGKIDTIDAGGGTIVYGPNKACHVVGKILFKNGTLKLLPGTVFFIDGHSNGPANLGNSGILLENATLDMNNSILTATCDTMWMGISAVGGNCHFNIRGTGGLYSEIRNAYVGISAFAGGNNTTFSYKLDNVNFLNNGFTGVMFDKPNTSQTDSINACNFTCTPSAMLWPYSNKYTFFGTFLYGNHKHTPVYSCQFSDLGFGVGNLRSEVNFNVQKCTFYNMIVSAMYEFGANHDTTLVKDNVINFPSTVVPFSDLIGGGVGPYYNGPGKAMGLFIQGTAGIISGNNFIGTPGLNQTGIVSNITFDTFGFDVVGNTFSNLDNALNNLAMKTQVANIRANTFNAIKSAIFTDNNFGLGITPFVKVQCNTFSRQSLPTSNGIEIGLNGRFQFNGSCNQGSPGGNKFTGYTTAGSLAINNTPTSVITYWKSATEAAMANWGNINHVQFQNCISGSGCALGFGTPIIKPTLAELTLAVQQLINNILLPFQDQTKLIRTVTQYYKGNCGPQYKSTINQMLPTNLAAYTALSWDFVDCNIEGNNIPLAISTMQDITYHNPTDIAIRQRTNFYTVYLNISGKGTYSGYSATAQDISLLAEVANSGTDYSLTACYMLGGLAPQLSTCFTNSPSPRKAEPSGSPNNRLFLFVAPNPFASTTKISYVLPENTSEAVLKVWDIRGQLIKTIVMDVNQWELEITSDNMANGVYLCGIEANGTLSAKQRIVVIK